jgi:hypothetical protein
MPTIFSFWNCQFTKSVFPHVMFDMTSYAPLVDQHNCVVCIVYSVNYGSLTQFNLEPGEIDILISVGIGIDIWSKLWDRFKIGIGIKIDFGIFLVLKKVKYFLCGHFLS